MKTRIVDESKGEELTLTVSKAEFEMLYDALDALNDRYESYADDSDSTAGEKVQAEEDLKALEKLHIDFQFGVKHVRHPKFGTKLPNGAVVIDVKGRVILAYNNCRTQDEYVTWKWDGEDLHSTSHGRYFQRIEEAADNFVERSKGGSE